MISKKLASLALAGLLSASSFAAIAASSDTNPTATPEAPSGKQVIPGDDKSPDSGNATGIDGKTGSMSQGADTGTTDGGPGTQGAAKGDGSSGASGGGNGSGAGK
jgi:hypothetical protein